MERWRGVAGAEDVGETLGQVHAASEHRGGLPRGALLLPPPVPHASQASQAMFDMQRARAVFGMPFGPWT